MPIPVHQRSSGSAPPLADAQPVRYHPDRPSCGRRHMTLEVVVPFSYVETMREFGLYDYAALPCFEPVEPAPLGVALGSAKVGLFASVGAHLPEQEPFKTQNDLSFRLVPLDVPVADLVFDHPSPIRGFALEDLNVAFPRDRLVELCHAGLFAQLAPQAVSMLGSITTYTALAEQSAPAIADAFLGQGSTWCC